MISTGVSSDLCKCHLSHDVAHTNSLLGASSTPLLATVMTQVELLYLQLNWETGRFQSSIFSVIFNIARTWKWKNIKCCYLKQTKHFDSYSHHIVTMSHKYCRLLFLSCKFGDFKKTGDCSFSKNSFMHTKRNRWQWSACITVSIDLDSRLRGLQPLH